MVRPAPAPTTPQEPSREPADQPPRRVLWLMKGLGRGGAERLVVDAAGLIDRDRFDVRIAYLLPHKDLLVDEVRGSVSDVVCLGRGGRDILWPLRLRSYAQAHRIEVVHSHSPLPGAVARAMVGRSRTLVHTEHNMWDRYHWATRAANAATYRSNRAVIAVSEGVAGSIGRRWLGADVTPEVVIHGTDTRRIRRGAEARAEARRLLGVDDERFVVGSVGNFTAKKDHATMLEAFATVRLQVPDALLVLVGSGPLQDDLEARAARPDLAGAVRFTGVRDDVEQLLAGLDVFAMSSRYEGLPIALLEAMSAGVAPVVTRVGGIPEVVDDDVSGLLVDSGDPGGLAAALAALAADPARRARLGAAAVDASSACDLESAVRDLERLYDRIGA